MTNISSDTDAPKHYRYTTASYALRIFHRDELETGFQIEAVPILENEFNIEIKNVEKRARACLEGRSNAQLYAIAEWTNHYFASEFGKWVIKSLINRRKANQERTFKSPMLNTTALLRILCDKFRRAIKREKDGKFLLIEKDEEGNEFARVDAVSVCDIFAVHALTLLVRANKAESKKNAYRNVVMAIECVVMAELELQDEQRRIEEINSHLSASGQKAANARWKKLGPARIRAKELYLSRTWPSRAAARRSMLPEIMQLARNAGMPLSKQNAERTIDGWLAEATRN